MVLTWPGPRKTCLALSTFGAVGAAAGLCYILLRRKLAKKPALVVQRRQWEFDSLRGNKAKFAWGEIAAHNQQGDLWIVIKDEVYNVTKWVEEHPGGKFILLAFAGRDASEAFEAIHHSVLATREMRHLHIGSVFGGSARSGGAWTTGDKRKATLTGGTLGVLAYESSISVTELWGVNDHGFLPVRDPVPVEALNGTGFDAFVSLVDLLPALAITGSFRSYLDGDEQLQAQLRKCGAREVIDRLSSEQLERAFGVVGYTMVAYWRAGVLSYSGGVHATTDLVLQARDSLEPVENIPPFLAEPMLALSKKLHRPPMIDYASSVLYNWTRIDKSGPISPSNVRCVLRLTGLEDEEWFFKTHVVIESEAAHAMSAAISASDAETDSQLLIHLRALEEALWRVVRACLPIMYDRTEDGTPRLSEHIFYHVLRPLISSGKVTFQTDACTDEMRLCGPSGAMSSLLPAIDAVLGIRMTSEKLRDALASFELSMPQSHRDFLVELRQRVSVRDKILLGRRLPGDSTDQHLSLVRSFNRCISRVLDFRWQHWQYIKIFIMKPGNMSYAVGTGGTSFDFLQQHITDTEQARLEEHSDGWSRVDTPVLSEWHLQRRPPDAFYPTQDFWSVDGHNGLLSRDPFASFNDFCDREEAETVQLALETLWRLVNRMPAQCAADGPFWELCEESAQQLSPLDSGRFVLNMSESRLEHMMTILCHIAAGCLSGGHKKIPRCIDRPLQAVARTIGRPPRLEFTEIVLCNWTMTPACGEDTNASLHVQFRFICNPDEEWYRAVHILLHHQAREVIAAIRVGQVANRDQNDRGVVGSLVRISTWFNKCCDYFDAWFERKDSRSEAVMMRRLSRFIARDLTDEEYACWVYCCGSSVLVPAVHAFLGLNLYACSVNLSLEGKRLESSLREFRVAMREYMPQPHRAFLEELERPGGNLRQYCFKRFGKRKISVETLHDLEVSYNDALNSLIRYQSRRMRLVSRLLAHMEGSFSALHADIEATMRKNSLQLLKMRQRVDRCLET